MKKYIKYIVIGVILVALLVGIFLHLSKKPTSGGEENITLTEADKLIAKDLDLNYPKSPRAVVKYYSEILECMVNDKVEEEDLKKLMEQARKLYDEDLLANNEEDDQWKRMVSELTGYDSADIYISKWEISTSSDVEYAEMDGREWASVHAVYTLKEFDSATYNNTSEVYLLRKDSEGKWKIYGWQLDENQG